MDHGTIKLLQMYNLSYFIKKFEAIPEENWTTFQYSEGSKHCVFGHCGMRKGDVLTKGNQEATALAELPFKTRIVQINDGYNNLYQQPTAKQRILAALYDLAADEAIKEAKEIINEIMVT